MKTETVDGKTLETWTPAEVADAVNKGEVVLIDVRTPQEYMFEHVEGALLLPLSFFKASALPGQSDKRIVFYCGSGVRSERVSRAALDGGLDLVAHLEGGFGGWKAAKLPYIGTNMATGAPQAVTP
ncbi:rhodanese-like domain-containing protein [Mesobacterium sp. TK19101]|uniref:Rhodanese-like domain-containing protein n=1 Tax=Mesobacterium hydrothermale TaxID=3111907 RepID=A0ABU6HBF3_9RHOB|nr:rhodanese-like domain-containing protein [Mesobacterium sp. TK19101]MEC3859798.1 rhodanese-like domain-containing protein [Mesobacterium sp. TK19101]